MPLIRYRTGDFTRLLPPCPCGGISRRIDGVSRREGAVSMELLDSTLFRHPGLIDYRASFNGGLTIEARVLEPGAEAQLYRVARALYPHLQIEVYASVCQLSDRPMYPGKRHIVPE